MGTYNGDSVGIKNADAILDICDNMSGVVKNLSSELDSIYALANNSDAIWQGRAATIFFDRFKKYNAELQSGYIDKIKEDIQKAIELINKNKGLSDQIGGTDHDRPDVTGEIEGIDTNPGGHGTDVDNTTGIVGEIGGGIVDKVGHGTDVDNTTGIIGEIGGGIVDKVGHGTDGGEDVKQDTDIKGTETDPEGHGTDGGEEVKQDTDIKGTESDDNFQSRNIDTPEVNNTFVENNTYNEYNEYFDSRESTEAEMDKRINVTPEEPKPVETPKDDEPSEIIKKLQSLINEVDSTQKGGGQ